MTRAGQRQPTVRLAVARLRLDQPLLCGIDAGTSQVRALVFTPEGTVVVPAPQSRRQSGSSGPTAPSSTRKVCGKWCSRCCGGSRPRCPTPRRSAASRSPASARPACCSDDDGPTADADHRLVRHAHHRRAGSAPVHDRLRAAAPDHRTVCRPDLQPAQADVAQARSCREAFSAARHWLNVGDYHRLAAVGERATDYSLASRTLHARSGAAQLGDSRAGGREIPSALLPPLLASGTLSATFAPEMAALPACRRTASWASVGTTMSAA